MTVIKYIKFVDSKLEFRYNFFFFYFFGKKENSFSVSQSGMWLNITGIWSQITMRLGNIHLHSYTIWKKKNVLHWICAMIVAQLLTEDCGGANKNITYGNDRAHAVTISCIVMLYYYYYCIVSVSIRARFNHISYTFDSLNTLDYGITYKHFTFMFLPKNETFYAEHHHCTRTHQPVATYYVYIHLWCVFL